MNRKRGRRDGAKTPVAGRDYRDQKMSNWKVSVGNPKLLYRRQEPETSGNRLGPVPDSTIPALFPADILYIPNSTESIVEVHV